MFEKKYSFGSEEFKNYFRNEYISADSKWRFLKITNGHIYIAILVSLLSMILLTHMIYIDFEFHQLYLSIIYFLFCNFLEYAIHRFFMHKKVPGLQFMFEHVTIHHRFYDKDKNLIKSPLDFFAVFLPIAYLGTIGAIIAFFACIIGLMFGFNHGIYFSFFAFCYYSFYELLHLAYHSQNKLFFWIIPFKDKLSKLHINHHHSNVMNHYNFNITVPLFDYFFNTLYSSSSHENQHHSYEEKKGGYFGKFNG